MKSKIIALLLLIILPINVLAASEGKIAEDYQLNLYRAKVIEVIDTLELSDSKVQTLKIEITNRDYDGFQTEIKNTIIDNGYQIDLKKGDKITVHMELNDDEPHFYFNSYDRTNYIALLIIIFSLCIFILGGSKGLKALISLIITISLILFLLVPLLLKGHDPILLSILTCIISAILTFIITSGFGKKTMTAIIGVSGGLIVGGLIAYTFSYFAKITGFSSGDAGMLQYLDNGVTLNFKGLLFAGIIIGALGACMDVAISIASSLTEIKSHNESITNSELIKSGLNIGRDIMGTMVNTLVLAYAGSSLASLLIFSGFNKTLFEIINLDSISSEIIRALSGSIGLLFTIPITIIAFIFLNNREKVKYEETN